MDNGLTYTVMPDYGNAAWCWVRRPGDTRTGVGSNMADCTTWSGDTPIPDELFQRFCHWAMWFESYADTEEFDWPGFHQEGLALAIELKQALGQDVRVIYEKPMEDPNYKTDERREIMGNGVICMAARALRL